MKRAALALVAVFAVCTAGQAGAQAEPEWSPAELKILRTLTLSNLSKLPPDPSNKYADSLRAADFGHRLFFDRRLSSNGGVACVTCHQPALNFTDGLRVSVGVGVTDRNAPTIVGSAYNTWFFWDGRKDSQWSQALGSIENPREQNMPRDRYIETIRANPDLAQEYTAIFGALPKSGDSEGINRAFANVGKAIAAYERRIMPGPAKFDRYVDAILAGRSPAPQDQLSLDESQGLHVFMRDQLGRCLRCHSGPLFTDHKFHNIAVFGKAPARGDEGRAAGVKMALADEFNCRSKYSDARPDECAALESVRPGSPALLGAFKVPTLRNLAKTAPYMHTGNRRSLNDVMWHYRTLPAARIGRTELDSFTITGAEFDQLEAFLRTLDGTIEAPARYLRRPAPLARKRN